MVGYEDLDRHGIWWNEPGYGHVWAPTYISIGWAPYRFGHWKWIGPWGFTWIDHTPWGYAPFHYGRWAHVRNRWCWVPGPRHFRPVWAPALVGWHGMPGVRDPSRPGSVSWFPLGPRDVYVPTHHASPRYVRAVNVSNTTIDNNARITNAWRGRVRDPRHANRDVPNAMSSLPAAAFAGGQSQAGHVVRTTMSDPGRGVPHLTTLQPNGETRLRGGFNTRRAEVGRNPPAVMRSGGNEQRAAGDQRRSLPRVPTDRRTVQGVPTESSTATDDRKGRRAEQPPKRLYEQRAAPADTWRQPQRDSGQFNHNSSSDSERSNRGSAAQTGGRAERSGNSSGEARVSGSGSQSGGGGAIRSGGGGGESRMSGSRSQSNRGGSIARP